MAGGSEGPFRVINVKAATAQIKALYVQAKLLGTEGPLRKSLAGNQRRLETDPLEFGEPLYQLRGLGLQVRLAPFAPLYVRFAVDEERRLVYVLHLVCQGDRGPS